MSFKWIDIFLNNIPIGMAEKIANITPLLPYYHLVSNERVIHVCHLYSYKNEIQFTNDVEFLCRRYRPISLADLIDSVKLGKKLKNGSFLFSFDDGYSQMYSSVAPILSKKGIPAIFFLNTDFIDNRGLFFKNKASIIIEFIINNQDYFHSVKAKLIPWLDVPFPEIVDRILSIKHKEAKVLDEIAELCGIDFNDYLKTNKPYLESDQIRRMIHMGFSIGAHSVDHPLYADLPLEEQLDQTRRSLQFIKERFDLPYSVFAFPHNDYFVAKAFFRAIENYSDLTFGTSDIRTDSIPFNFQRIDFENSLLPAQSILARFLFKKRVFQCLRKAEIKRT